MTDHRTRLASREPMTVEEEAEDLLRRQRAGLIREVDVGPCEACGGYQQLVIATSKELELLPSGFPIRAEPVPCATCNGTGRRYRSGLDLAAYCGHEASRLALWHGAKRHAETDANRIAWWLELRSRFGANTKDLAMRAAGVPDDPTTVPAWLPRLAAQSSQIATDQAKVALIRWALTEP